MPKKVTKYDLISRQAAIDAINHICPVDTEYDCTLLDRVDVRCVLSDLPSAQPALDEWCTDCKEYDSERHCCPRFNRVIRETLKEVQPDISEDGTLTVTVPRGTEVGRVLVQEQGTTNGALFYRDAQPELRCEDGKERGWSVTSGLSRR